MRLLSGGINKGKKEEKVRIKIEGKEDIYYLSRIIELGDKIGMVDFRTTSRGERGEKIRAYLIILVEKINVDYDSGCIRVLGKIEQGPEDVLQGYHSFDLCEGSVFDIYKEWKEYQWLILKKAEKVVKLNILAVVLDEKEATFGEITQLGVKELYSLRSENSGKYYDEGNKQYYKEILNAISNAVNNYDKIILAGPGFTKDNIYSLLADDVKSRVVLGNTSITGITGLNEIVKRGIVEKVIKDTEINKEISEVENLLLLLSKNDSKVAYGVSYVYESLSMGAVEKLLVLDTLLSAREVQDMIEMAEKAKAKVIIISSEHEGGKKLDALGGIAGILRYEIH